MAALGSQSIASSYEQLLHVDRDGGGNGTTHVSVKDGDNGTTFGFTIASDALMMSSTNRLEFGDNGTYIHQSSDGVLAVASDGGINVSLGSSAGNDFNIDSGGFVYEGDNGNIGIGTSSPADILHVKKTSGGLNARIESADSNSAGHLYQNITTGTTTGDGLFVGIGSGEQGYMYHYESQPLIFGTGGTEKMRIDSSGNVTMSNQPCFAAYNSANDTNVSGDGTAYTVDFNTEVYDLGGNFASDTFTAPVAGKYFLATKLNIFNVDADDHTTITITLKTSNRDWGLNITNPEAYPNTGVATCGIHGSALVDMDASDTAYIEVAVAGSVKDVGISGAGSPDRTWFSGYLCC